jgi:DNA-binding FrmR family transcriptional regulator
VAGYSANKGPHLNRLSRIEGQVRGIARMVEDDKYCIDILTQVAAASRALRSVALGLLADHMNHCFTNDGELDQPARDAKLKEAADAIARLVRS